MNRREVEELLNEHLRNTKSKLDAVDDFYKEFNIWKDAIKKDAEKLLSSGSTAVPTTPGASLRLRRRLSTVVETSGNVQNNKKIRNKLKNTLENVTKEFSAKKARLLFKKDDDQDSDTEDSETLSTFSNDSLYVPLASTSKARQNNVEQVDEEEEGERASVRSNRSNYSSKRGRKGRVTRNTRSNARTQNGSSEKFNFVGQETEEVCSIFEAAASTQDSDHAATEERKGSFAGRRGRKKTSNVYGGKQRITRPTRNASCAKIEDSFSKEEFSEDSLDLIQASTSQHDQNSDGSQENGTENVGSMRRSKQSFIVARKASVIEASRENSTSGKDVRERKSEVLTTDNICKSVSIPLTRIDEEVVSTSFNENVPKSANRVSTMYEHTTRKSVERKKSSDSRKRSLSSEELHPSKKTVADRSVKEGMEMNEIEAGIEAINNVSQDSLNTKTGNNVSSNLHDKVVVSSVEISSPISEVNDKDILENDVFEDKDNLNDIADSGKGNSDSDVECSKYYSLVESGNNAQDNGKEKISLAERTTKTPDRGVSRKGVKSPALFSPYANEPVKNRVAAYEVLSTLAEEGEDPKTVKRVTRTKTRAMAAAAAAAAAAASTTGDLNIFENKSHFNMSATKSHPSVKVGRMSWRLKKKLGAVGRKNNASKENSLLYPTKNTVPGKYVTPKGSGKILGDVNGLSSSMLNSSRKTPFSGPKTFLVNSSNSQFNKSAPKQGVLVTSIETFINKPTKVQDMGAKKFEEQRKREEKEKEAQKRREEILRKQAEEKRKKRDEMRLRVQEKREAQDKEKQESQLRVGREKDEKWNVLQQEREAKQKENVLKKKLESERKAAEARRKLEEAEVARIAKLKLEEQQRKKEQEAAEIERLRHIVEDREAALLREKTEQKVKDQATAARDCAETQKLIIPLVKLNNKVPKVLDSTFTIPLDSTFTPPSTTKKVVKVKNKPDNAFDLEELQSGDSGDEEDLPKKTACWAMKSELVRNSKREIALIKKSVKVFTVPDVINISEIFPSKRTFNRTSSAIWNTPPRYSALPKY